MRKIVGRGRQVSVKTWRFPHIGAIVSRMCFSATASFTATAVTGVAGVAALRSATRPAHRVLGAIPLIFASHQFAEGVLWLALSATAYAAWARPAMFAFLAVGEVVWPFWVPLAILVLEDDPRRRKVLTGLLVLGSIVAAARAFGLVAYPVSAAVAGRHIQYHLDTPPVIRQPSDVAYAIVTVVPPFVSKYGMMRVLGLVILASLVVSKIFFYETFISVWCFFAALISALIVVVVRHSRRGAPGTLASAPVR